MQYRMKNHHWRIVSIFVKYVSCLRDTVCEDFSSLSQLLYKFYNLTLLHHVNYE